MKTRDKILLSIAFGLVVMLLEAQPMWWGVLFSPVTEALATAPQLTEEAGWLVWQTDNLTLRFKSLDLLLAFFQNIP